VDAIAQSKLGCFDGSNRPHWLISADAIHQSVQAASDACDGGAGRAAWSLLGHPLRERSQPHGRAGISSDGTVHCTALECPTEIIEQHLVELSRSFLASAIVSRSKLETKCRCLTNGIASQAAFGALDLPVEGRTQGAEVYFLVECINNGVLYL
jgi:hypothetical protein